MRTLQEIYTIVRRHLLSQMRQSRATVKTEVTGTTNLCAYRGEGGLKCAVGILIPDSKYHPGLETHSVSNLDVAEAAGLQFEAVDRRAVGPQIDLADALQKVHDGNLVENWGPCLNKIAKQFKLKVED